MNNIFYRTSAFFNSTFPYIFRLPPTTVSTRNESVETLRGLAIILVVFGHMIGYTETGGMRVSNDSVFRYLYYSLEYIRLPLFTVISGWVYANKPVVENNGSKFIKGKFRRLIIPMLIIGTFLFFFRMVIPGTNSTPDIRDLPRNVLFPYDIYWYLYSLFIIFVIISLLDKKAFFHRLEGWSFAILGSLLFLFVSETFLKAFPNLFSFKGAAYLFPFFLIGIGLYRFSGFLLNKKMTLFIMTAFIVSTFIQQLIWFEGYPLQNKVSLLGITVGICGALLLFRLKFKNSLLIWIGDYAYGIFLFHVFFTGGTRILLMKLGVHNLWTILIVGVIFAILFSILLVLIISKSPFLKFYLLGLKKHER